MKNLNYIYSIYIVNKTHSPGNQPPRTFFNQLITKNDQLGPVLFEYHKLCFHPPILCTIWDIGI